MFSLKSWGLAAVLITGVMTGLVEAQPALTTIQDILYRADGNRFNGTMFITWSAFQAGDTSNIATANVTGVVALLLAKKPDLSAGSAGKLLRDTSLHDSVDACAAVAAAVGRGACEPYAPATEARSPL